MGAIAALFGFGAGVLGFGLFWKFFEDIMTTHIQQFILVNFYYEASDLIWEMLPWICVLTGVIALVLAGVMHRAARVVTQ